MNTLKRNHSKEVIIQEELYFFEQSQRQIQAAKQRPQLELIRGGLDGKPAMPTAQAGLGRKAA